MPFNKDNVSILYDRMIYLFIYLSFVHLVDNHVLMFAVSLGYR